MEVGTYTVFGGPPEGADGQSGRLRRGRPRALFLDEARGFQKDSRTRAALPGGRPSRRGVGLRRGGAESGAKRNLAAFGAHKLRRRRFFGRSEGADAKSRSREAAGVSWGSGTEGAE